MYLFKELTNPMKTKRIIAALLAISMSASCLWGCSKSNSSEKSSESSDENTISSDSDSKEDSDSVNSDDDSKDDSDNDVSYDDIKFEFTNGNSWNDNGTTIYQLDGKITNNQSSTLSDWSVSVEVGDGAEVKNSWGLTHEIKDGKLIIKPDNNTGNIISNGTINFGIQLSAAQNIDASTAVFKAANATLKPSDGNSNNNNNNSNSDKPANTGAKDVPEATSNDWLSVKGLIRTARRYGSRE